ncbi:hypothetical protein ACTOV4_10175 [Brucella sp. C7-11G]
MNTKPPKYSKVRVRYSQSNRWAEARRALPHTQLPLVYAWSRVLQAKPEFATEAQLNRLLTEIDHARRTISQTAIMMDKAYAEFAAAIIECWQDARLEAETSLQSREAA